MTSKNKKAPLHKLYDAEKSLEYIKNRYIRIREMMEKQITALQQDQEFKKICQKYNKDGYPDWVILSAIMNCVINTRMKDLQYDVLRNPEKFLEISEEIKELVYSPKKILKDLDKNIKLHAIICLPTYGFELRRKDITPEVVERFLRERMVHYSHDLPHNPLFGESDGNWPV
ncbi:hypothetical protein ISS40_01190 [Candidatus Bathyarchaeota archaeon]|nr:hypothetical protein [Candidatus Bathyarchaeota archaeon]